MGDNNDDDDKDRMHSWKQEGRAQRMDNILEAFKYWHPISKVHWKAWSRPKHFTSKCRLPMNQPYLFDLVPFEHNVWNQARSIVEMSSKYVYDVQKLKENWTTWPLFGAWPRFMCLGHVCFVPLELVHFISTSMTRKVATPSSPQGLDQSGWILRCPKLENKILVLASWERSTLALGFIHGQGTSWTTRTMDPCYR